MPTGVEYLSGVEAAERINGGLRWNVGSLTPGAKRAYRINCQLNASGTVQIAAAVRAVGDLQDDAMAQTTIETVADLVLSVEDPKGPLPVNEDVTFQIRIVNRGTRTAHDMDLVMHFSDGIEPNSAEGLGSSINPGEVLFNKIRQLEPNDEMVIKVIARANTPGTHAYRVQLTCTEADSRELSSGTTKFYGNGTPSTETAPVSQAGGGQRR